MNNRKFIYLTSTILAIATSFTDLYSISYLIAIILGSLALPHMKLIPTITGRVITSFLLLCSTISITGLLCWLLHMDIYPIVIILVMLTLLYASNPKLLKREYVIFNRLDLLSLVLVSLVPILSLISFSTPNPTFASMYQYLDNGWDNAAHISMLETAGINNSYVYGKSKDTLDKTIVDSGAYPQAWHLANANIINGIDKSLISPNNPLKVMVTYTITINVWFMIASFLIVRTGIELTNQSKKRLKWGLPKLITFICASSLILTLTTVPSLLYGFANYLGLIALLIASLAILLPLPKGNKQNVLLTIIGAILATASVLFWFLPAPAIFLTLVLLAKPTGIPIYRMIFKPTKTNLPTILILTLSGIFMVLQVFIYVLYSDMSGANHLLQTGGVSTISNLLVSIIIVTPLLVYWAHKRTWDIEIEKYLIIILPTLLLTASLFAFQDIFSGSTTYYFYKLTTIIVVLASIFFIPECVRFFEKLKTPAPKYILSSATIVCSFFILLISSGQSLGIYKLLLQQNSKISYPVAKQVTSYLVNKDYKKYDYAIFTSKSREHYTGDVAKKITHLPLGCLYNAQLTRNKEVLLKNINECAKSSKTPILVIVDKKTESAVLALNNSHIKTVLVK